MRTVSTILFCTFLAGDIEADERPAEKPQSARDGEFILGWLHGHVAAAGRDRFGDGQFLREREDVVFYTDVAGLGTPKWARRVTYEGLQSRSEALKNGHRLGPLVLIAASTREKPLEGNEKAAAREVRAKPDPLEKARFYYVEVGIGNLAWHWIRLAVYEVDGKPRIEVLEAAIS